MPRSRWIIGVALAALTLTGAACDDPANNSANSRPVPATRPAAGTDSSAGESASTPATTAPAETQPTRAYLTINEQILEFPPARLRLTQGDDGVSALLFSDDPKNAVSSGYSGNGFYFDMHLDIPDPESIARGQYFYRAQSSSDSDDSPTGIFLDGMKTQLQPQEVLIRFTGEAPRVQAQIAGRFLVVQSGEGALPGQTAVVNGTLLATVEVKQQD